LARGLVTTQIALSVTLLAGSGLLINSLSRLLLLDPGYRTHNILTMKIDNANDENCHKILERAKALPGVRAALVYGLPLSNDVGSRGTSPPQGHPANIGRVQVYGRVVTPGYFELMGISLLTGRDFTAHDHRDASPVIIINERLAQLFWPGEDPIGRRFKYDMADAMVEVVGVVRDTKSIGLDADAGLEAFLPRRQLSAQFLQAMGSRLIVTSVGSPKALIETLRKEIWSVDKHAIVTETRTMEEIVDATLAIRRFLTVVLSVFSFIALFLACFGIYGIMAHSVRRRTHEVGIRMALGASTQDILRAVVVQGAKLTLVGVVCGLAGAVVLTRTISSFLYEVGTTDPLTFFCVACVLTGVSLLACYIPARRAARIDPMAALRYE